MLLLVDDVDGEPVRERGDDHVDEPDHGLVVGLEGGGEHVPGPGQDGHVLSGVFGAQTAAPLGLVEPGALDRRRRPVGHQRWLQIKLLESWWCARAAHLDHPDDLTSHEQRRGHE